MTQRSTDAGGRRRSDKRAQQAQLAAALARAQALFGKRAAVDGPRLCGYDDPPKTWHPPLAPGLWGTCSGRMAGHGPDCPGDQPYYLVGTVEMGLFFVVKGEGRTWDEAFEDVERRAAADRVRYSADGICTAPAGACGYGRRVAKRPTSVDKDGTMRCACGSPMRRKS